MFLGSIYRETRPRKTGHKSNNPGSQKIFKKYPIPGFLIRPPTGLTVSRLKSPMASGTFFGRANGSPKRNVAKNQRGNFYPAGIAGKFLLENSQKLGGFKLNPGLKTAQRGVLRKFPKRGFFSGGIPARFLIAGCGTQGVSTGGFFGIPREGFFQKEIFSPAGRGKKILACNKTPF